MDYHKNAPWTAISRERLARMVISDGITLSSAAARFSVSAKTAAKWVDRYRQFGAAGMADRSSRPHHSPRQTSSLLVEKVLALRRLSYNGWRIGRELGLSPATVSRILRRARLSRWRDLNPPPPVVRYEHPGPGDLLHLDIKGMTQFGEVSLRGDGRLRGKRRHPGFLALHVAVDDHSRMAFTQMLPDQKADTTIGFLHAALGFFARHGIRVRALLTDNGGITARGPWPPGLRENGHQAPLHPALHPANQRQSRTLHPDRLARMGLRKTLDRLRRKRPPLQPWNDYYNRERPHGSLNHNPPMSRSDIGTTS